MNKFENITNDQLMSIEGGKNQEWYDMGKEIGAACHDAYDAVCDTVSSAVETVKGWF